MSDTFQLSMEKEPIVRGDAHGFLARWVLPDGQESETMILSCEADWEKICGQRLQEIADKQLADWHAGNAPFTGPNKGRPTDAPS